MNLQEIFNTVTANESREMTFERFKQAVGEVLIDYTKWLDDMGSLKLYQLPPSVTAETILQYYLKIMDKS